MKKPVLFSLIVGAASQTVACTSSSSGGSNGYITASWNVTNLASQSLGCPTGFNTAALYSQEIDGAYNDVGAPTIDLFNCSDYRGVSARSRRRRTTAGSRSRPTTMRRSMPRARRPTSI